MYHMHIFVASTCMHVVHSDGFRFGDGFVYNLSKNAIIRMSSYLYIHAYMGRIWMVSV